MTYPPGSVSMATSFCKWYEVTVTIYLTKEHPRNRALVWAPEFYSQNVTILCHPRAGRVFWVALCDRSPLPSTFRRFSSRRQQADYICRLPNHLTQATSPVGCGAVAPRSTTTSKQITNSLRWLIASTINWLIQRQCGWKSDSFLKFWIISSCR